MFSGLSVGSIPAHTPLCGTGLVQGLSSNPTFAGPYKPTALSPFGVEASSRLKEPDHFGLGLSSHKSQEDKIRGFGQVSFSEPSLSSFGSIGTDLSPPGQRLLPPPAHQGISNINPSSSIGAPSQIPIPPVFRSTVQDRTELFSREPFSVRDNIVTSFGANRDLIPRGIDSNNSFSVQRSLAYCESPKPNSQYGSIRTSPDFRQEKITNFSPNSCDRISQNSERFSGFSDTQPLNFVSSQRVPTTEIQRQTYSPQQSVYETKSESYVAKRSSVTIQAVADSTTKPKKPRVRKKKDNLQEELKQDDDRDLVNRYIEQEQQLRRFSNIPLSNQRQNNNFISNSSPVNNVFGQSYSNNNSPNVVDQFQMQNVKSQEGAIGCTVSNSSGMSNTFGCSGHIVNMENIGPRNMEPSYRNSPMQQDTYTPQGMELSGNTNNFMPKSSMFNDGNLSGQNRMMEGNTFGFGSPPNQPSFVEQLNSNEFDNLELEPGVYSSGNLCNLDTYNTYGQNFCNNASSSTVDETALSDLISNHPNVDRQERFFESYNEGYVEERPFIAEPTTQSASVVNPIEEDEEFEHLKKPPIVEKKPAGPIHVHQQNKSTVSRTNFASNAQKQSNLKNNERRMPVQQTIAVSQSNTFVSQPTEPVESTPVTITEKTTSKANKNNAFMDSFLSFLQGKKPETLASVNSSVTKKPELPKYYPEPKRPRPPTIDKNCEIQSLVQMDDFDKSDSNGQSSDSASSSHVAAKITGRVKSIETGNEEHPSLKMKITLQKTPPKPKKMKIKTPKSGSKNKRSKSYQESDEERASGDDAGSNSGKGSLSPIPVRRTSTRKAKVQESKVFYQ